MKMITVYSSRMKCQLSISEGRNLPNLLLENFETLTGKAKFVRKQIVLFTVSEARPLINYVDSITQF